MPAAGERVHGVGRACLRALARVEVELVVNERGGGGPTRMNGEGKLPPAPNKNRPTAISVIINNKRTFPFEEMFPTGKESGAPPLPATFLAASRQSKNSSRRIKKVYKLSLEVLVQYYPTPPRPDCVDMSTQSRSTTWCFTLNNPTEDEVLLPQSWDPETYKYLVYQLEQGENGTPHLQGYISFNNQKRFSEFRKYFVDERAHVAVAKGTAKQNRKYCTKEEGRIKDRGNLA